MGLAGDKRVAKTPRVRARRSAVQALYQWAMSGHSIADVIKEFESDRSELARADVDYFRSTLRGIDKNHDEVQQNMEPFLDRPLSELDPVESAILKLGVYELLYEIELPYRVVINECVELAKMFGAEQSHKYINGILDKAARNIRVTEFSSTGS